MHLFIALFTGTLFGLGLSISQMIDPAKVINFLDITGTWDPSLALVMIGALAVNIVAYYFTKRRETPLIGDENFHVPAKKQLDKRLISGAALFGMGWGIAGYCPGPAITSLSFVDSSILYLMVAYIAGTWGTKLMFEAHEKRKTHVANEACTS